VIKALLGMGRAFFEKDARLIEVNPFVIASDGRALAADTKIVLDDNGLYRNAKLRDLRDPSQEDPREAEAGEYGLSYVALDGTIGCMVNGAGLAMATMDLIQHHGSRPANFLDVGGGATVEKVTAGFKIILQDKNVKAILVNIFGGIVRCNIIATGIIEAVKEIKLAVPLVVRLEGTARDQGKKLLRESGLQMTVADSLEEAAEKAVERAT
jgi:succinyl-CoA synthetase beta subunit